MSNVLESEVVTVGGCVEPGAAIDEEEGVSDLMFLLGSKRNIRVVAVVLVGYSPRWSSRLVAGSTAAYSQ